MTGHQPQQACDSPDAYWDFVTVTTDSSFEGQHFDRMEAGRPEADGTAHNTKLNGVRNQIEECVSAFASATGGLLALGVSSTGVVAGLKHLNESPDSLGGNGATRWHPDTDPKLPVTGGRNACRGS